MKNFRVVYDDNGTKYVEFDNLKSAMKKENELKAKGYRNVVIKVKKRSMDITMSGNTINNSIINFD